MRQITFALLGAASLSFPLSAQTKPEAGLVSPSPLPAVNADLAVTDAVRSVLAGKAFDEGHIAILQSLGHQQAVAATCPGFAIDQLAFLNEFDFIYDGTDGKPRALTLQQRAETERTATLALGMVFGGQIAIAANGREAFCKAAGADRASGKVAHLVWSK